MLHVGGADTPNNQNTNTAATTSTTNAILLTNNNNNQNNANAGLAFVDERASASQARRPVDKKVLPGTMAATHSSSSIEGPGSRDLGYLYDVWSPPTEAGKEDDKSEGLAQPSSVAPAAQASPLAAPPASQTASAPQQQAISYLDHFYYQQQQAQYYPPQLYYQWLNAAPTPVPAAWYVPNAAPKRESPAADDTASKKEGEATTSFLADGGMSLLFPPPSTKPEGSPEHHSGDEQLPANPTSSTPGGASFLFSNHGNDSILADDYLDLTMPQQPASGMHSPTHQPLNAAQEGGASASAAYGGYYWAYPEDIMYGYAPQQAGLLMAGAEPHHSSYSASYPASSNPQAQVWGSPEDGGMLPHYGHVRPHDVISADLYHQALPSSYPGQPPMAYMYGGNQLQQQHQQQAYYYPHHFSQLPYQTDSAGYASAVSQATPRRRKSASSGRRSRGNHHPHQPHLTHHNILGLDDPATLLSNPGALTSSATASYMASPAPTNGPNNPPVVFGPNGEIYQKPPYSYAALISKALRECDGGKLTLSGIYDWIKQQFPYYRTAEAAWQVFGPVL